LENGADYDPTLMNAEMAEAQFLYPIMNELHDPIDNSISHLLDQQSRLLSPEVAN
jgi:hypothetical protein